MKHFKIILFIVFSVLLFQQESIAQDPFSYMSDILKDGDKKNITKAKGFFNKAKEKNADIKKEDNKVSKRFRKKKKNAEKKAVKVKEYRIDQAKLYNQAYSKAFYVYDAQLDKCEFVYSEDAERSNVIREAAVEKLEAAQERLKTYKNYSSNNLKGISYTTLKNDLKTIKLDQESSIKDLMKAYDIFLEQATKLQADKAETKVWNSAQTQNTIKSYDMYLSKYPRGKYAKSAHTKKQVLIDAQTRAAEEARRLKELENRNPMAGTIYEVQISAAITKIPLKDLARIYPKTEEIKYRYIKDYQDKRKWHKYTIGNFKVYSEAARLSEQLNAQFNTDKYFVVCYEDGVRIKITKAMKDQN